MAQLSSDALEQALNDAGAAHHDYEQVVLGGTRDEQWAGFYAAFVIGRLGDIAPTSSLSRWLADAPADEDWSASAASYVLSRLSEQ